MTIDEKFNTAKELFYNYYLLANKQADIKISDLVLKETGFGREFFEFICPRLKTEGLLKNYYPAPNSPGVLDGFEADSFVYPSDEVRAGMILAKAGSQDWRRY